MRQGNFSEISTAIKNPFTGQPFPGNIIPAGDDLAGLAESAPVLPDAECHRARPTTYHHARRARTTSISSSAASIRTSATRSGCMSATTGTTASTHSIGAIPVTGVTQPRVNKNTLFTYTHTLKSNLLNDFRIGYHRLDFDTLNQFSVNGQSDAGTALGIPGFDGDTQYSNPGLPSVNVSTFSSLAAGGTNWYQFDTTFQTSDVLAWNRGSHNVRTGFDLRRLAPAGARPTIRAASSTSPATSAATRWRTSCSDCRAR